MPLTDEVRSLTGGTRKGVALALLAWLALSVTATAMVFTAMGGSSFSEWLSMFRPILLYWLLWAAAAPLIYRIVVHVPFSSHRFPMAVGAHLTMILVFTVSVPVVVFQVSPMDWLLTAQASRFHRMNLPIYVFILLVCSLLKHYRLEMAKERHSAEMALAAAELANQLQNAQMDALKARINPHFIFNALNAVAALVETRRNAEAYRAIELLGSLLRETLEQSRQTLVPLVEELRLVRRYIELERERFGDRLSYSEELGEECGNLFVPSLILLPIVENAIKHGVARASGPVHVNLRARLDDHMLSLAVADSGPGLESNAPSAQGLGLSTTEERLTLHYGAGYSLSFADLTPTGVEVTIHIPARTTA